ncbi:transcriptional regulator-domain-containing protein [Ilyonectria robusta]|uniref:transcriptional regulator-domain-containing protein n=1 Tax=Ilyonectria robusta TaxID=1079257 RepID=UPI001E8E6281|nr:transcriptional regulator-domain-containing protein [Ilyonectria robusta]KAH8737676.1 transcriptional regulator-domain-containing protein [Ilyonectria robusta]
MSARQALHPLRAKPSSLVVGPRASSNICRQCHRSFTTTPAPWAGHNKWSKTKHIKAVTDKKKMSERQIFTKTIAMYSRMYGDNLNFNPQLANAITAASKASIPKHLIEAAVARGQGRSTTGAQLESMSLEVLMPPDIALIVDAETDNKTRTLHDLRLVVKKAGGVVGSTAFYFTRRGRAVFKAKEGGPTLSEILDEAIEHDGMEDVEELPDGNFLAWTQPNTVMAITEALSQKFELEVLDSEIVWAPNEDTKVNIDSPPMAETLDGLFSGLKEYPEVKAIYANVRRGSVEEEEWDKVERNLDV